MNKGRVVGLVRYTFFLKTLVRSIYVLKFFNSSVNVKNTLYPFSSLLETHLF